MKQAAVLANKILEATNPMPPYKQVKNNITQIFKTTFTPLDYENIMQIRLAIIDGYYSTNMGRRLFGIEDISAAIKDIAADDAISRRKFDSFLTSTDDDILKIFTNKYGIKKNAKDAGRAISIISKYAYFLTEFNFPIYDNFVNNYILEIKEKNNGNLRHGQRRKKLISSANNIKKFFERIIEINNDSHINNFNKLDNLCWLYGKVNNASYGSILTNDKYKEFMYLINVSYRKSDKQKDRIKIFNRKLKRYINNDRIKCNQISSIIGKDLLKFIKYTLC